MKSGFASAGRVSRDALSDTASGERPRKIALISLVEALCSRRAEMARIKEEKFGPPVRTAFRVRAEQIDRVDEPGVSKRRHCPTEDHHCAFPPCIDFRSKNRTGIGTESNCLHDAGR